MVNVGTQEFEYQLVVSYHNTITNSSNGTIQWHNATISIIRAVIEIEIEKEKKKHNVHRISKEAESILL